MWQKKEFLLKKEKRNHSRNETPVYWQVIHVLASLLYATVLVFSDRDVKSVCRYADTLSVL